MADTQKEHLAVRADLFAQLRQTIAARGLDQADVARILRVPVPRAGDLLRGRTRLFSTDALIDMLASLGVRVRLVVDEKG